MQQVGTLDPSLVQELVDTATFLHDAGELAPAAYRFFSAFGARLLAAQGGAVFGADEPRDWLAAASALNEDEGVAAAQLDLLTRAPAPAAPAVPVAPAAPVAPATRAARASRAPVGPVARPSAMPVAPIAPAARAAPTVRAAVRTPTSAVATPAPEPNSALAVPASSSSVQAAPAALETASAPGAATSRTAPVKKGKAPAPRPKNKGKTVATPIDVDAEVLRVEETQRVSVLFLRAQYGFTATEDLALRKSTGPAGAPFCWVFVRVRARGSLRYSSRT